MRHNLFKKKSALPPSCHFTLLSAVDELAREHTFSGNEELFSVLELVGVAENDTGKGGTTTGIVNNLLDDTADVTVS